jgi:hypothetical protein
MRLATAISALSFWAFPNSKALGHGQDLFVKKSSKEVFPAAITNNMKMVRTIRNRKIGMNNMKRLHQTPSSSTSSNPDIGILSYGHAQYTYNYRNLQDISMFDYAQQRFCQYDFCSCTDINKTASTMFVDCEPYSSYCEEQTSACGVNSTDCFDSINYVLNITGEAEYESKFCYERSIPSKEKVCYFDSFVNVTFQELQEDLQLIQKDSVDCAVYFNDEKCQNCEGFFTKEVEQCDQNGTCRNSTFWRHNFDCTNTEGGTYSCYASLITHINAFLI